jgi:beta-glucosidase-like glycosyl hydrolase
VRGLQSPLRPDSNKTEDEFRDQGYCELKRFVEDGEVSEEQLNESVKRILRMKYNLGLFDRQGQVSAADAAKPMQDKAIIRTARTAAEKCAIVLRDEPNCAAHPGQSVMVIEHQCWMVIQI